MYIRTTTYVVLCCSHTYVRTSDRRNSLKGSGEGAERLSVESGWLVGRRGAEFTPTPSGTDDCVFRFPKRVQGRKRRRRRRRRRQLWSKMPASGFLGRRRGRRWLSRGRLSWFTLGHRTFSCWSLLVQRRRRRRGRDLVLVLSGRSFFR